MSRIASHQPESETPSWKRVTVQREASHASFSNDDSQSVAEGLLDLAGQIAPTNQDCTPDRAPTRCTMAEPKTNSRGSNATSYESLEDLSQASTAPDRGSSVTRPDTLQRGIITLRQTVELFCFYFQVLDPYICDLVASVHGFLDMHNETAISWGSLDSASQHKMLPVIESVRSSSHLLFVAILCAAALHTRQSSEDDTQYPELYREYIRLAAIQPFSRHQKLDDIRALVIGSFWFNEVSWTLVGTAVRIVTERHMHESYARWVPSAPLLRRKRQSMTHRSNNKASGASCSPRCTERDNVQMKMAYEEARLYYLIYIADHQGSIPYRRPPMTRQHEVIRRAVEWLSNCPWATNRSDTRLVALVKMWEILHDSIDEIGSDLHAPLDELGLAFHARFHHHIETWFQTWVHEFSSEQVFERTDLHRQRLYAELFLHSMAFRTVKDTVPTFFTFQVEQEMKGETSSVVEHCCFLADQRRIIAEKAVDSAYDILNQLRNNPSPRDPLVGQASYCHTMTAFAIVLLVRALKQFGHNNYGRILRGINLPTIL